MDENLVGSYDDPIILQINHPKIVNVASADYTAASIKGGNGKTTQKPFIVCHSVAVSLKVETWKGDIITWTFTPGPYPLPLRKIFTDAGNSATLIQIGY